MHWSSALNGFRLGNGYVRSLPLRENEICGVLNGTPCRTHMPRLQQQHSNVSPGPITCLRLHLRLPTRTQGALYVGATYRATSTVTWLQDPAVQCHHVAYCSSTL